MLNDKTRAILSDKAIKRRAEICQVNIKVTFIVWLVEFFGCMTMAIDFLVIGSRSNSLTGLLRTLTLLAYFVLLPITFLVNCSETKEAIMDSSWRTALAGIFKCRKKTVKRKWLKSPQIPLHNQKAPMLNQFSWSQRENFSTIKLHRLMTSKNIAKTSRNRILHWRQMIRRKLRHMICE